MPATATDRLAGITTSVAIKPACVAVVTSQLTLSGLFTLGGVALEEGDRVLVIGQNDPVENGIYNASTSDWSRALDFDGARDVVSGTLVIVRNNISEGAMYEVTTLGNIVIGETNISFRLLDDPTITYSQTQAEIVAGVIPADHSFPPLYVDRYGINIVPGTTSMTAAFQAAINVARKSGGVITWGVGPYLLDGALDATTAPSGQNCCFAMIGHGRFKAATLSKGQNATPSILVVHNGIALDTTGSLGIHLENWSVAAPDPVTYPAIMFLLARNSDGASRSDRIINCYVNGRFHKTILYNYGAEDGVYDGNQFYNSATDANASVFDITANNIRGVTSTFTTIASGVRSTIDHKIIGGEYANFGGNVASHDVFRWEAVRSIKVIGPWMDSSKGDGSTSGRSLIYVDGTNGPTQIVTLIGIDGESNDHPSGYGILISANAQSHANWTVIGNTFPNIDGMLGGGTGATLSQLTWLNNTNQSQGAGISFSGTPLAWQTDSTPGGVSTTPASYNETFGVNQGIRVGGEPNFGLCDTTQAAGAKVWKWRLVNGVNTFSKCDDNGVPTANGLSFGQGTTGFNGAAALAKPTVSGAKGGNVALGNLITALAVYGLITDSTT